MKTWFYFVMFCFNQEEEQRIRRLASNIAKDVKKFWTKIEKLVQVFEFCSLFSWGIS